MALSFSALRFSLSLLFLFASIPNLFGEQSLPRIPLPSPVFFEGVDDSHVRDVTKWANEAEAWCATDRYEVFGKGEFGRVVILRDVSVSLFKAVRFRLAEDPPAERKRIYCFQAHVLGNEAPVPEGMIPQDERASDYLKTGTTVYRVGGSKEAVEIPEFEVARLGRGLPTFNPIVASHCGVDQTLNGGALESPGTSFGKRWIRGTHQIGGYLHVLMEYGDGNLRLNYMATFLDGYPVQWDWVSVSKDEKFQVWESTRTEWKDFGTDIKLPIKMHGVRTHRVRPGEFYFEFDWLLGENVSEGIFDKETIGKIDFVP